MMKRYFSFVGEMEVEPCALVGNCIPEPCKLVFTTGGDYSTDVYEAESGTRYIYEGNDLYKVVERVGFAAVPDAHLNSYTE